MPCSATVYPKPCHRYGHVAPRCRLIKRKTVFRRAECPYRRGASHLSAISISVRVTTRDPSILKSAVIFTKILSMLPQIRPPVLFIPQVHKSFFIHSPRVLDPLTEIEIPHRYRECPFCGMTSINLRRI